MATPVFCCGFECGVNTAHTLGVGTFSYDTTTKRSGARSLRCNPTAATGYVALNTPLADVNTIVGRVYVRFATLPSASCEILTCSGGTRSGAYFNSSDSKIYAADSTSAFGATGVAVTTGVWYRIDVKVVASANPWLTDVRVDGTACAQKSRATAGTTFNGMYIGSLATVTADMYFDDLILSQTGADYPFGAGYVNHFVPTADGTHNVAGTGDFLRTLTGTDILNATTTAYQLVDDVPLESGASVDWINMAAPVNNTDYVECVFGPAPGISTPNAGPRAVEIIAGIHQAATTTGNMEIKLNDNGNITAGVNGVYTATGVAGVTSVAYKRKHYPLNVIGGPWTAVAGNGNFNNLKVRFGSPGTLDVVPDQYFDCIMIEAEFVDVASIPNKIYQVKQAVNRAGTY